MPKYLSLEKFVTLRSEMLKEQAALAARLALINQALGTETSRSIPAAARGVRGGRRRSRNPMPLKEAVLRVTRVKPLKRQEIVRAVRKIGYKFATKDPLNSLNGILYTSGAMKNLGGRFVPAK